jgi:hypothetical protein
MKRLAVRLSVPSALALSACSAPAPAMDAGYDAGPQDSGLSDAGEHLCPPGPDYTNDQGMKCTCELGGISPDGGIMYAWCCDPDIGNPCPACCLNPKYPDGGRQYEDDAGTVPYCLC